MLEKEPNGADLERALVGTGRLSHLVGGATLSESFKHVGSNVFFVVRVLGRDLVWRRRWRASGSGLELQLVVHLVVHHERRNRVLQLLGHSDDLARPPRGIQKQVPAHDPNPSDRIGLFLLVDGLPDRSGIHELRAPFLRRL